MNTNNRIGYAEGHAGTETLRSVDPQRQVDLAGEFVVATASETEAAVGKAHQAWKTYRKVPGSKRAEFLRAIAAEIEALGDTLVQRAMQESGLPKGRIEGERGRTCGQLRLFAQIAEEGSWVEAVIDEALPDRKPLPRVDIRNMLQALGPIVVFTASNFPLAFSTAGGDTASALAAGCPVIVKAHPAHLGTNALVSEAILRAARKLDMPDGVFSSLQDGGYTIGTQLVQHPLVKGVAFTGSQQGGLALHRAAMSREEPIPVFAEMGSVNPIFLLPERVSENPANLATQIAGSVNLGAGQFCTNPGLLVVQEDAQTPALIKGLQTAFGELSPSTMLHKGIHKNYVHKKTELLAEQGVQLEFAKSADDETVWQGLPAVGSTDATTFIQNPKLHEEVFGPFTLLVKCQNQAEMEQVAHQLEGQLTATLMGESAELGAYAPLIDTLEEKVGRLIYNGLPTGVEVGYAMQHGGPFPATTDPRFTSVGAGAIKRFARPIAIQNAPDALLPPELQAANPLGIMRKLNGEYKK